MVLLLSWDVGIVNLAYCLIKFKDNRYKIIDWQKINLIDGDILICKYPACVKKATLVAGDVTSCGVHRNWIAKESDDKYIEEDIIGQISGTICDICDSDAKWHFPMCDLVLCTKHKASQVSKLKTKWKIRAVTKKSSKKYAIHIIKLQLIAKLDQLKFKFNNITNVVIENQPGLKHPRMKSVAGTLMNYFLIRGIVDKDYSELKEVRFMSPSNKLKLDPKSNSLIKTAEKKYKMTKQLAVEYCRKLVQNSPDLQKHFESFTKKDDLADALLQGLFWYYHVYT